MAAARRGDSSFQHCRTGQLCDARGDARAQAHQEHRGDLRQNHSFDNLYGMFRGQRIANATAERKRNSIDGKPLKQLTTWKGDGKADPRFPVMPVTPFASTRRRST
jgi:hypothetical protein